MDYSDLQVEVLNIPRLESLGNGKCCKKYWYRFTNVLPDQNTIDQLVKQLDWKYTFSKDIYEEISEDVNVYAWLSAERLNDYEAVFIVLIDEPEESVISIYGIYSLPIKIEKIFGIVDSVQGDSRKMWIKSRLNH